MINFFDKLGRIFRKVGMFFSFIVKNEYDIMNT